MTNKDYLEKLEDGRKEYSNAQRQVMKAFRNTPSASRDVVTVWEMFSEKIAEYDKKIAYYSKKKPSAGCKHDYEENDDYDYLPF